MDALDDLAMALAVGLPIVLVSGAAIFLALTDEEPAGLPDPFAEAQPGEAAPAKGACTR